MRKILLTVILIAVLVHSSMNLDPCDPGNHIVITGHEAERRSTGYKKKDGEIYICDRNIRKAWYRVESEAGGDMPTFYPGANKCSTAYSLWIEGDLSMAQSDGIVQRTVCTPFSVGTWVVNKCLSRTTINVKNCGNFRVYELVPTSGCPQAYCFGTKTKCEPGFSSETGYEPGCTRNFYKIISEPTVKFVVADKIQIPLKQVVFTCNIGEPITQNLRFDVVWYVNGKKFAQEKGIPQANMPAKLYEHQYKKFGINVNCKIRGRIATGVPGPYVSSKEPFYAGIKILTPQLVVKEGGTPVKLYFTLTVPLVCPIIACHPFQVEVNVPRYQKNNAKCVNGLTLPQLAFQHTSCGVRITENNWNKQHELDVVGAINGVYDGDAIGAISLSTGQVPIHPAWSNYKALKDVIVKVIDEDSSSTLANKMCRSVNDPHMTTFDGRQYECQLEGEFILYRHKTKSVEVQSRYKTCGGTAKCNCGVAVRSGGDVFIVDQCSDSKLAGRSGVFKVGMVGCDRGSGLRIEQQNNGRTYVVHLPTGGQVKIQVGGAWLNLYVIPSVLDIGNTEGLCGTLNHNCEDDLKKKDGSLSPHSANCGNRGAHPNDFSLSWKVDHKPTESLFQGGRSLKDSSGIVYCDCQKEGTVISKEVKCAFDKNIQVCADKANDITKKHFQQCRRRRDAGPEGHDEIGLDLKDLKITFDTSTVSVSQWTNGWTESKAKQVCTEKVINSKLGIACNGVLGVQPQLALDQCMQDIKYSGKTMFISSAASTLAAQCENQLIKNVTAWTDKGEPPLDKLGEICLNECNYNGQCQKGKCVCKLGYGGDDCSIDITKAPSIALLYGSLCDTNKRPCKKTPIHGNAFLQSSKLVCRVTPRLINGEETVKTFKTITSKANFISFAEVFCPLPAVEISECDNGVIQFDIQVSNDQIKYSKSVQLIRFNSIKWSCTERICKPKESSLSENGFCNLSTGTCNQTIVSGGPFIKSSNLKCQLIPILVHNHQANDMTVHRVSWSWTSVVVAHFHSTHSVTCPLPQVCSGRLAHLCHYYLVGYEISVSNDGENFPGKKLRWLSYDPKYWKCATEVKNGVCNQV